VGKTERARQEQGGTAVRHVHVCEGKVAAASSCHLSMHAT
jgi:hypothetical protein